MPDADMMQRLAEVLEISVSQLLGEEREPERNRNEIAEQLSRISEQLAIKNRRSKRIWTAAGVALAAFLLIQGTAIVLSMVPSDDIVTYTVADGEYRVLEDMEGKRLVIEQIQDDQYIISDEDAKE